MASESSGIKDLINSLETISEKKKILIIDDDPGYINLIRGWLRDDYKVFMSTSGDMALDWLAGNSTDLILLDFEMPDYKGPEMLARIRESENKKPDNSHHTPIIYITGNESSEIEISIASNENAPKPDGCIFKTIGRDTLLRTIPNYIK